MKGYLTFEEFLRNEHANQYVGTDDDMPDDFDNWLGCLDGDEYMEAGERYGQLLTRSLTKRI